MKKVLGFIVVLIIVLIIFAMGDAVITEIIKVPPILHITDKITNGKVYKGLVYDVYVCDNNEKTWVFFNEKTEVTCYPKDIVLTSSNLKIYYYQGYYSKKSFTKVITNLEELEENTKNIIDYDKEYNENFFNKKNILIAYIPLSSSTTKTKFKNVTISKKVIVNITKESADKKDSNMTGYIYFIEIDKEYLEDKEITINVE